MQRLKVNDCDSQVRNIETVGDLKNYLKDIDDKTSVYLWDVGIGGTVYGLSVGYREQECVEHSGKVHWKKGVMIEIR